MDAAEMDDKLQQLMTLISSLPPKVLDVLSYFADQVVQQEVTAGLSYDEGTDHLQITLQAPLDLTKDADAPVPPKNLKH